MIRIVPFIKTPGQSRELSSPLPLFPSLFHSQTSVLVRHALNARSSSLETLCFFLTLLAPAVTPLFVLSERWIHMPCGCFINCKRGPRREPSGEALHSTPKTAHTSKFSDNCGINLDPTFIRLDDVTECLSFFFAVKKRKFEFNLSFQQGYGVYKLSHATASHSSPPLGTPAYHDLFSCDFSNSRLDALQSGAGLAPNLGPDFDLGTACPEDSSSHAELLLEAEAGGGEAMANGPPPACESGGGGPQSPYQDHNLTDASSVFEGSERRLSHVECRTIELTDWEWCRSKSERTPRQVHAKQ